MTEPDVIEPPAAARYGKTAILLHWAIAFALVFEITLGFTMPHDASGFALIQLHKSVGIAILLLSLVRLGWRLVNRAPPQMEGGAGALLAKAVHALFYVLMIGLPLTGWAMVSTDALRIPTMLFGTVPWPHLPLPAGINGAMEESHELLAWIGVALTALHVAGALRHQLLLRDGLLARMGPGGSAGAAGLLGLAALALSAGTAAWVAGSVAGGRGDETQPLAASSAPLPDESAEAGEETEAAEEETEAAMPPSWKIQPGGRLGFTLDSYRGSFSDWRGDIRMDPDSPNSAEIRITVNLASASVSDAEMDTTLRGPEFLAAATSPNATWRSTSVSQTGPGRYTAAGMLTLKGASRPQSLNFTLTGKGTRRHVEGSASIDRNAFGVGTGPSAEGMGGSVSLNFSFDAVADGP